jgi:hypothetical protein
MASDKYKIDLVLNIDYAVSHYIQADARRLKQILVLPSYNFKVFQYEEMSDISESPSLVKIHLRLILLKDPML